MKQLLIFSLILSLFAVQQASAQTGPLDLPGSSVIPHYRLFISYNTTTVLVFPAAVKPVDRGDKDVIAQKQPGVENVLKLKAARHGFPPTNLHVFASNGIVYAFDIYYTDSLATTHNLTNLVPTGPVPVAPPILFSSKLPNTDQMDRYVSAVEALKAENIVHDHHDRMKLSLESIGLADGLYFFRMKLTNHSLLDYKIDFIRLYIRDRQRAKRSSVQDQETLPIYQDSAMAIAGNQSVTHVLAVPAFTLANHKEFLIEVYEKNGGRSLTLLIRNRNLFKAKKL